MKLRGTVYVVAIVAIALAVILLRGRAKEDAWSLQGQAVTADTCMLGCPCLLGERPPHGKCQFVGIFHVDKGEYGDASLDNVNFAVAGEFARPDSQARQTYRYVAYYIDTHASSRQKRALKKILTGSSFAHLGKPAEVREMPISLEGLESFGQVGKTYGGSVGHVPRVAVTPLPGAAPDQPIVVTNSAEPLFHWTALGKATRSFYKAANQNFQFEGTSGESHRFKISGGE